MSNNSKPQNSVRDACVKTLAEQIARADSLLVLTHVNPDGDGLGAMAAFLDGATAAGKRARGMIDGEVPVRYGFLFPAEQPADVSDFEQLAPHADLIVILDTCSYAQMGTLAKLLGQYHNKTVVIDHHATRDDIGFVRWADPTAAAAGLMMVELLAELQWSLTAAMAEALATAIVSDTGWMRFSNTNGRCLRAMAKLLDMGVAPNELYDRLFHADRPQRLALLERALSSLEYFYDGQLAVMSLRQEDFAQTGADMTETENLINEALRVKQVEAVILLTETPDLTRVSLRSRRHVDVAALANQFGGGGHARAAGLKRTEPLDTVRKMLINAFGNEF